jgi:NTE family protein
MKHVNSEYILNVHNNMSYRAKESHPRHKESRNTENVLVLQGGGSLGAFACGVFKALVKKNIRIDIAAGTSIGAVNAAIIVGSKSDYPEKDLEDFWIESAESSPMIIPDTFMFEYDTTARSYVTKKMSSASANAAIFGVPKMFVPRWRSWNWDKNILSKDEDEQGKIQQLQQQPQYFFDPRSWTYLYDHSQLAKTLDKYIDYKKLNLAATQEELPSVLRLIITAVDVMTSKPLVFDNTKVEITAKHILASSGYPIYGFPWVEIEDGVYGWDGSLLSNTPVREVLSVSPRDDKNIFIVENYPRKIHRLPSNMAEVESRAKDIIFSDKNMDNIKMSKLITRQIQLIERLYEVFDKSDQSKIDPEEIKLIKSEYNTLINNYGAEIKSVTRIIRSEVESPTVLQNADFSPKTIKELIAQGERKTMEKLATTI